MDCRARSTTNPVKLTLPQANSGAFYGSRLAPGLSAEIDDLRRLAWLRWNDASRVSFCTVAGFGGSAYKVGGVGRLRPHAHRAHLPDLRSLPIGSDASPTTIRSKSLGGRIVSK